MPNTETETRSYSLLAKTLIIGVPVLLYVLAATQSTEMREALTQGTAPTVADVAMGGSLFLIRLGAIVLGILGTLLAFFGSPKETAPKWMLHR